MTRPDERGEKAVRCIRDLPKPLTNPYLIFGKQGATTGQFHVVLSEDFCTHKILSFHSCRYFQIIRNFSLVFAIFFSSRCNWNVLSQFGISQYNIMNVQMWPKFRFAKRFYDRFPGFKGPDMTTNTLYVKSFPTPWLDVKKNGSNTCMTFSTHKQKIPFMVAPCIKFL